jgi:hypothetical protein
VSAVAQDKARRVQEAREAQAQKRKEQQARIKQEL